MGSSRRQIPKKECAALLRMGMNDEHLMERYQLSSKGLKKLYQALIQSKTVGEEELYKQSALFRKQVDHLRARDARRVDLNLPLWVYEVESSRKGLVRDISETGMRVAGIASFVGETKNFRLPVDMFIGSDQLVFSARCVWVETTGKRFEYSIVGYRIAKIAPSDREVLRKLVGMLVLSGSGEWSTFR